MALVIEQCFLLGRFHATRWNQNPFEDLYGEWPPSPWRLLRTLAARWVQYSRETGDQDDESRDALLRTVAETVPSFHLPELSWRGPAIRQYQPTGLEDQYKYRKDPTTKKQVLDYSYKEVNTTLVQDHCWLLPPEKPLFWIWDKVSLTSEAEQLLRELLRRTLYFGRAESHCMFRSAASLPIGLQPNCFLAPGSNGGNPVLVPRPGMSIDLDVLLAATDDRLVNRRRIPPGSTWYYAKLPSRPMVRLRKLPRVQLPSDRRVIQFAVGGRVYPPIERWVKLTERFRGRVLRLRAIQLTGDPKATYDQLGERQREALALLSGKDSQGRPLENHSHAFFLLWPDNHGQPTRVVCLRNTPFTPDEVEAILAAAHQPIAWESRSPEWSARLVPLPFETLPPPGLLSESKIWVSATPFVPPGNRRRFRKGGRQRPGETPDSLLVKLLVKCGFPKPVSVEATDNAEQHWVYVHAARSVRQRLREQRTPSVSVGYRFRITFPEPVQGPICVGHSSHFGLGLFLLEQLEG